MKTKPETLALFKNQFFFAKAIGVYDLASKSADKDFFTKKTAKIVPKLYRKVLVHLFDKKDFGKRSKDGVTLLCTDIYNFVVGSLDDCVLNSVFKFPFGCVSTKKLFLK